MEQTPLIELKNIHKQFRNTTKKLFDDACISIHKREIVGVLGNNGCGKTTLSKIIGGLIKPEKGEIFFNGKRITRIDKNYRENICILGDANRSLYWNLSGKQNLEYFSKIMDVDIDESFLYDFIDKMKMNTYIDNKVANYSKGMKQKLLLLIALVNTPQLIIMDEPLNGLDLESIYIIEDVIKEISKKNDTAFLITSHDKYFIDEVCSIKYVINDSGKIEKKNDELFSIREFEVYIKIREIEEFFDLANRAELFDEDRNIYKLKVSLNDHIFYKELSVGIQSRKINVVSIQV